MDGTALILLVINLLLIAILGYVIYSKFNLLQNYLENKQTENKTHLEQIITALYNKQKQSLDVVAQQISEETNKLKNELENIINLNHNNLKESQEEIKTISLKQGRTIDSMFNNIDDQSKMIKEQTSILVSINKNMTTNKDEILKDTQELQNKLNNYIEKNQQNLVAINGNITKIYDKIGIHIELDKAFFSETKDSLNKQNEQSREIQSTLDNAITIDEKNLLEINEKFKEVLNINNNIKEMNNSLNDSIAVNQKSLNIIEENTVTYIQLHKKDFSETKELLNKQNEKLKEISYDVEIN